MAVATLLWTVVPLILLHGVLAARSRRLLRFQLVLDLVLLAVTGPAILRGHDLDPVRALEGFPPFTHWAWQETTAYEPSQSDVPLQFHPWWDAVRRRLRKGRFPALDPWLGAGVPLYGNGQTGLAAPVMAPVWLLGPERGTTVMAFWKIEAAGFGAFLLLAAGLGFRRPVPELGGVLWAGSPYLVAWLLVPLAWVAALLPWCWWLAVRLVRGRFQPGRTALTGLALGWLLGCGLHPESALIVVGSAFAVAAALHPRRVPRLLAAGAVAALVASVLALPTLRLIAVSSKAHHLVSAGVNRAPLPAGVRGTAIRQALLPPSVGHPAWGDWRAPYPHPAGAVGVGTAALVLAGLGGWRRRRLRLLLAAGGMAVLSAVLLYRIPPLAGLLARVPPIDLLTLPRFGVLLSWSLVVASAASAEGVAAGRRRLAGGVLVLGAVALVAVLGLPGLSWRSAAAVVASLAAGAAALAVAARRPDVLPWLAAAELAVLALGINPPAAPEDRVPRPPVIERLVRRAAGVPGRIVGLNGALPANVCVRYGLEDLRSSDPLRPWPLARLHALLGAKDPVLPGPLRNAPPRLLGAWSVRWAVTPEGRALTGWSRVDSGEGVAVWENPMWCPEIRLARTVVSVPTEEEGWRLLASEPGFLPEGVLIPPGTAPEVGGGGTLAVLSASPERVETEVVTGGPAVLVVARCWLPGWRARIDGRPAPVVRANLAALGVVVPPGRHRVRLVYDAWALPGLR